MSGIETELPTVTFRRKEQKTETQFSETNILDNYEKQGLEMLRESHKKLEAEQYTKLVNVLSFLNSYPEFIDAVNDNLMETANKLGWKNTV